MSDISPIACTVFLAKINAISDEQLHCLSSNLSREEMERYHGFIRKQRQRQFVAGRILLRIAVGKQLSILPGEVDVTERYGQAPCLILPDVAVAMPGFSISHSGNWVACAVCAHGALGLDIEVRDPARDVLALAGQVFDAASLAQLSALAPPARLAAFYTMWSEREARFKLGAPVASCIVLPHPELSIVLCSALALAHAPSLTTVSLG